MIHNARVATIILMTVCTLALLLWDCHCMANKEVGDTISELLRTCNKASGGLAALVLLAVWIHVFLSQYLPEGWR